MAAANKAFGQIDGAAQAERVDPAVGLGVIKALNAARDEMRIFIDTSNGGGHQTTTLNMVKRLIDYGFQTPIRIFYDSTATLELFLAGYVAPMTTMKYRGVTLNFQPAQNIKVPEDRAPLLICGGSEATLARLGSRLKETNCSFYLQLQPWCWKSIDYLVYGNPVAAIPLNGQEALGKSQFTFSAYAQPTPQRAPDVWALYASNPKFASVVAVANTLCDNSSRFWTMPVYGLTSWKFFVNLALAADRAQSQMPGKGLGRKPIVLLSFGSLLEAQADDGPETGGELLARILNADPNSLEDYPELRKRIEENRLPARCHVLSGQARGNFEKVLSSLPEDGIVVLSMGSTPNEVFNYLYAQATLPLLFEGRGTLNLALNLGKPYLCTTFSADGGYPGLHLDGTPPREAKDADACARLVMSSLYSYKTPEAEATPWPSTKLGDGIVKLLTDQPTLRYFSELARIYGAQVNDRLLKALRFCAGIEGFPK